VSNVALMCDQYGIIVLIRWSCCMIIVLLL